MALLSCEKLQDKRTLKDSLLNASSQLQEQVRDFLDKKW